MSNIKKLFLDRDELSTLITPVMNIIKGYEQILPNTCRRIKVYREYHDVDWDNGVYAPYERLVQEDSIPPSHKEMARYLHLNSHKEGKKDLFDRTIRNLKALAGWHAAPNSYVLTPELTAIISRTFNTMLLPSSLLWQLPEWCSLIAGVFDPSKEEFGRIMVDKDLDSTGREKSLNILMVTDYPIAAMPALTIKDGLTIGGSIARSLNLPYEMVKTDLRDYERQRKELGCVDISFQPDKGADKV